MIRVENLQKSFKGFKALKGIDLNVEKGIVYGFLGHNGAGKSTTINILAGFSRPDSGFAVVNGWDLSKIEHPGDLHIGYLPEEPRFYSWMSAREYLCYIGSSRKKERVEHRADEMLDWVGLKDAGNRRIGGFSRGMKQRLGMACALFHDPALLLLDEPSSALDPEGRSDVLKLINDLKQEGKTVFLSTHILSDAERVCDRIGILSKGQMILEKPLKQLLDENVKSVYDIFFNKADIQIISKIADEIMNLPGVLDTEITFDKLSVQVDDPDKTSGRILVRISEANISVREFSLRRASLEDIFMEEVGRNGN